MLFITYPTLRISKIPPLSRLHCRSRSRVAQCSFRSDPEDLPEEIPSERWQNICQSLPKVQKRSNSTLCFFHCAPSRPSFQKGGWITKEVGWIFHHESSMICSNGGEALRVVLKKAFISSERSWQALDTPSSLQKMSQNQDFIRTPLGNYMHGLCYFIVAW